MTTPIKPRVDDDGVPWCHHRTCARYDFMSGCCRESGLDVYSAESFCLPAVLDLAAEVAAWRAWDNGSRRHNLRLSDAVKRTDAWRPK